MPVNYLSNKQFYTELIEYKKRVREAEDSGEERPQVPESIGKALFLIARRLATKANFSGYSYKEEMISDGIENCIKYIDNFDPNKSENPFAYFTQIIKFAFIRRIKKEGRQQYFKMKNVQDLNLESILESNQPVCKNLMTSASEFVGNYEAKDG